MRRVSRGHVQGRHGQPGVHPMPVQFGHSIHGSQHSTDGLPLYCQILRASGRAMWALCSRLLLWGHSGARQRHEMQRPLVLRARLQVCVRLRVPARLLERALGPLPGVSAQPFLSGRQPHVRVPRQQHGAFANKYVGRLRV